MATNNMGDETWNENQYFFDVELNIESCFEGLIIKLMRRRDTLLNDLKMLREDFMHTNGGIIESLLKTKESRNEMKALLEKVDSEAAKESFIKALDDFDTQINTAENSLILKQQEISYLWDSKEFDRFLPNLGVVYKKTSKLEPARNYAGIEVPQIKFGRHGKKKGEFSMPRSFCIEEGEDRILVADGKNSRIQVWTLAGNYMLDFGKKHLKQPWGVCKTVDFVFVSDSELNAIFKFNLLNFQLIQRTKTKKGSNPGTQLSSPAALAVQGEQLYCVEYENNRISVFSLDLNFIGIFGKGLLVQPICIKTANEFIFVSEMDGTIKHFSEEWKLTKVFKRNHIFSSYVCCFCLDRNLNFFVCDRKRNTILVMSQDGKLIFSLNSTNWSCGSPFAIEITRDERLVCSLQNGEFSIIVL